MNQSCLNLKHNDNKFWQALFAQCLQGFIYDFTIEQQLPQIICELTRDRAICFIINSQLSVASKIMNCNNHTYYYRQCVQNIQTIIMYFICETGYAAHQSIGVCQLHLSYKMKIFGGILGFKVFPSNFIYKPYNFTSYVFECFNGYSLIRGIAMINSKLVLYVLQILTSNLKEVMKMENA